MNIASVIDLYALEDICIKGDWEDIRAFMKESGWSLMGEEMTIKIESHRDDKPTKKIVGGKAIFCKVKERGHFLFFIESKPDGMIRYKWEFVGEEPMKTRRRLRLATTFFVIGGILFLSTALHQV